MKTKVKKGKVITLKKVTAPPLVVTIKEDRQKKVSTAVILASVEKQAVPLLKKIKLQAGTKIKTAAHFEAMGVLLKDLSTITKIADNEKKGIIKPMRDGVNASIQKVVELFLPFFQKVSDVETEARLQMSLWMQDAAKKREQLQETFATSPKMTISSYAKATEALTVTNTKAGASIRKVWKSRLKVEGDESKIPRKYLEPNWTLIDADLKAGKKIAGVVWEQVEQLSI